MGEGEEALPDYPIVEPAYITDARPSDNLDSMAVHGKWVYVTAKGRRTRGGDIIRNGAVQQYDLTTGEFVKEMPGFKSDRWDTVQRPNGIAVVGNIAYVVDRENVSVTVASFAPSSGGEGETWKILANFGWDRLIFPYGVAAVAMDKEQRFHRLFVTDSHPTESHARVLAFSVRFLHAAIGNEVVTRVLEAFGDSRGPGVIHKAESLAVSPDLRYMLIADEHKDHRDIKVYDWDNKFMQRTITGFHGEPEGIATFKLSKQNWFWVCADQTDDPVTNSFRVYDGQTLRHHKTFRIAGVSVTDGICISQAPVGRRFPEGVMVAADRDQSIAVVDLRNIRALLADSTTVATTVVSDHVCTRCGKPADMRCSRCRTPYCGRDCQSRDWPLHITKCL